MKGTIALTLMLVANLCFSLGRTVSYDEVRGHLFGSIQSIETCGAWRVDGKLGEFRVIKLYYAGQDMLFVDIVSISQGGSVLQVEHGFTFPEINNDHSEIELERIECHLEGENRIRLKANAVNGHTDERYEFSLIIDGEKRSYKYEE